MENKKYRSITISEEYFKRLFMAAKELELLEASGVDNWNWYGEHWQTLIEYEAQNEDEKEDSSLIMERLANEQFEKIWREINE